MHFGARKGLFMRKVAADVQTQKPGQKKGPVT